MILFSTVRSPYGRKVRIAMMRLGMDAAVTRIDPALRDPADPLLRHNPLGKMPCLVLEDGTAIYDSSVILDYLDQHSRGALVPRDPAARLDARIEEGLADGIMDAGVAIASEGFFHPQEHISEAWVDHQRGKLRRALAAFVAKPPAKDKLTLGGLGLACALGYLDWRKPIDWRTEFPSHVAWLDGFRGAVPEFDATDAEQLA